MLMIGHVWKLWRYDESRIRNSVEVMITYTWIEELVERGKMDALQYSVSIRNVNVEAFLFF